MCDPLLRLARHPALNVVVLPDLLLRRISAYDWRVVHEWASTAEAYQYQGLGSQHDDRDSGLFVEDAVASWRRDPQDRYVWSRQPLYDFDELKVRSQVWQQSEISFAV